MSTNFYGFTALIGGTAGCLDYIDGASLANQDQAFGTVLSTGYEASYVLDASSGATPDDDAIITPVANAGTKRWIRQSKNKDVNTGDNATNSQYSGLATSKDNSLTPTAAKTSAYNANANEYIPVDLSGNTSFAIQLPSAPADKTRIQVQIIAVGTTANVEIKCGGTDKYWKAGGVASIYLALNYEYALLQYQASTGLWFAEISSIGYNFANNFTGIGASTPITNANIAIDTTALTLTVTPTLGFFDIYVDGGGKCTRYRKGTVVFGNGSGTSGSNTWTDTSGAWYFYFNSAGQPVTTQTAWTTQDFPTNVVVYRILWNATLSGAAKLVAQYVEYHVNDIDADTHQWMHLSGAIWGGGSGNGDLKCTALTSGAPDVSGVNTCVSMTTTLNIDDNLEYTVTNSTAGTAWTQDLGNVTPTSITSSNSGMFKVFVQSAAGLVSFLAANRYPFSFSGTNVPEFITSTGTRTAITNGNFMVNFIYATQNPIPGDAIKVVSATAQFTSLANARAFNWIDIQNAYPTIFGYDMEIRPMYRLIHEVHTGSPAAYNVACKYAVLRETQDLRKAAVASTTTISGSLPASSVTFVPYGTIAATNAQSALQELDDEKVSKTTTITATAPITIDGTTSADLSANRTIAITASNTTTAGFVVAATAPAAGNLSVLGIANAETGRADKLLLDSTAPSTQAFSDAAAAGTSLKAARVDHKHAMMTAPSSGNMANLLQNSRWGLWSNGGCGVTPTAGNAPTAVPFVTDGTDTQLVTAGSLVKFGGFDVSATTTDGANAAFTAAGSLLTNGGFDSVTTGWTGSSGATLTNQGSGKTGNCLRIATTSAKGYAYQSFTTVVGGIYIITWYTKDGSTSNERVTIGTAAGGTQNYDSGNSSNSSWTNNSNIFTATATTTYINLWQNATAAANVYFDSVAVYDSTWVLAGFGATATLDTGKTGNGIKLVPALSIVATISQAVTVTAGHTYMFSGYAYSSSGSGGCLLRVGTSVGNGSLYTSDNITSASMVQSGVGVFTAAGTTVYITIYNIALSTSGMAADSIVLYDMTAMIPMCVAADTKAPDFWTKTSGLLLSRETSGANTKAGSYYALYAYSANNAGYKVTYNGSNTTNAEWIQRFAERAITFGAWVKSATASAVRLELYDGSTATYSSYHSGGGNYEWLEVSATMAAVPTEITVTINFTQACYAYISQPDLVFGSSIGSGNYVPMQNEVLFTEATIALPMLLSSSTMYLRELTFYKIPAGIKAVNFDASQRIQTSSTNTSGSSNGGWVGADGSGNTYNTTATLVNVTGIHY